MFDEETTRWLEKESLAEGNPELSMLCSQALGGILTARVGVEEAIRERVARAHREHCGYGHR
jgi:hypothetical protein